MRNCHIENAPCFLAAVLLDPLDFAIRSGAASVRWMTVLPFGKNVYSERRQARLDAWNAAILRTPDAIDARGCFGEFLSPIYQSDGTHLNPLGHTTFADYVSPLICS